MGAGATAKGCMELGRLLSRLPASTVRLRLRVTLTFGVFLVGSHQGALGIIKRARTSWREPFDDRITVEAVSTAQSRVARQRSRPRRELAHPTKHWSRPLLCNKLFDFLENTNNRFGRESRQPCRYGIWTLARVTYTHIMTGRFSTIVSRLVQHHGIFTSTDQTRGTCAWVG